MSNIDEYLDISKSKIYTILDELESQDQIKTVFKGKGKPNVYLPIEMYDAIKREQPRPSWIHKYSFNEKEKILKEIEDQEKKIGKYHKIENLLSSTGTNLEESVCEAFQLLDLENLDCSFSNPQKWDFSFSIGKVTYVCDAKGKRQSALKKDIGQLEQWLHNYLDDFSDLLPQNLKGLLIINHFKNINPSNRWPNNPNNLPITDEAERFLNFGHEKYFITTIDIFEIVKDLLEEKIDVKEANRKFQNSFKTKL